MKKKRLTKEEIERKIGNYQKALELKKNVFSHSNIGCDTEFYEKEIKRLKELLKKCK